MVAGAMENTKRFLADVPQDYVFWCCDGRILKNMRELRDAFVAMSEDSFTYHVNAAKNDFHNWVRDIIKDERLASDLLKATSKTKGARIVTERIAFLNGKKTSAPTKNKRRKLSRR